MEGNNNPVLLLAYAVLLVPLAFVLALFSLASKS